VRCSYFPAPKRVIVAAQGNCVKILPTNRPRPRTRIISRRSTSAFGARLTEAGRFYRFIQSPVATEYGIAPLPTGYQALA